MRWLVRAHGFQPVDDADGYENAGQLFVEVGLEDLMENVALEMGELTGSAYGLGFKPISGLGRPALLSVDLHECDEALLVKRFVAGT
jgi:hypothetical protein